MHGDGSFSIGIVEVVLGLRITTSDILVACSVPVTVSAACPAVPAKRAWDWQVLTSAVLQRLASDASVLDSELDRTEVASVDQTVDQTEEGARLKLPRP